MLRSRWVIIGDKWNRYNLMFILIYGEDTFRVNEKVKQIKTAFKQKFDKTGLNTASFPAEDSSKLEPADVLQAVCSYPFLGEKRMVFVRDLISNTKKADQNIWIDGFKRMPESTIVVVWEIAEPSTLEKNPMFKELLKIGEVHSYPFPSLEGVSLAKWASDRVNAMKGKIDRQALQELVERVGSDLWQMSHDIEKLVAFANGNTITKLIVEEMVRASFEGNIFELMDAVSKKQTVKAIRLLEEERCAGSDDHYLLTMLGRQVRLLLGARSMLDENPRVGKQDVASALGVHPYAAQKALEQARQFSFTDLCKVHDLLFEYDQKIKTGRIGPGLAVDLLADQLMLT